MTQWLSNLFYPALVSLHSVSGNWWTAILLFTLVAKAIQFPLSLWSHVNGITMVSLMPDLYQIKTRYFGDREKIDEKQSELYKERHYHALLSLVPLVFQILILLGLVGVIRMVVSNGLEGTEGLGIVPAREGGIYLVAPLLAGCSALVQGLAANRLNPLQREQSRREQLSTNGLSIVISLVLGLYVPLAMVLYWIASNLLSIPVQLLCNRLIPPSNRVDYTDLKTARDEYESLEAAAGNQSSPLSFLKRTPESRREAADYKRFLSIEGKHIAFYSEGSGFWKYYKGTVEWLLSNSDARIHYITKDPNDQVFEIAKNEPRLLPYYISEQKLITLMMKMDVDVMVLSTPELDNYYLKRSRVRNDVTYVFIPHHMSSMHLVAGSKQAYDHFDSILCVGPHQVNELRRMEQLYGLPERELVEVGYSLLDDEVADYQSSRWEPNKRPTVLIAPSWNDDNILDLCIDDLLAALLGRGWRVIVRPHPEYTKRYRPRWDALKSRYAGLSDEELVFEDDFASNASILTSDCIITDWSSVAMEFSFTTLKPSLYVDTPMKVANPDWEEVGIVPLDISIRNEIGRSVSPDDLSSVTGIVEDMLGNSDAWVDTIREARSRHVFNLGTGAEAAGEYLLGLLLRKQEERSE